MKLVEAESTGPVEGDAALVTPPRPPHRRVSVSLLFTLTVLVGTVLSIYTVFPARHNVLVAEAIERHRDADPAWDLTAPSPTELRAWAYGVAGKDVLLPRADLQVVGVRQLMVLNRPAALIGVRVADDQVTYLVQHARGIAPAETEQLDGDLRAVAWHHGPFAVVAVGADATASRWLPAIR
ncbi:MAG: hypothetical protein H7138_02355, partial [Myxococcales bacterium]|nr:hypothetical protein [Myxococcales bacterium]